MRKSEQLNQVQRDRILKAYHDLPKGPKGRCVKGELAALAKNAGVTVAFITDLARRERQGQ